jgi:hypothetical protein
VLPPTHRQKPSHKKPNGGGYAAAQTFDEIKTKKTKKSKQNEKKYKFENYATQRLFKNIN